MCVTRSDGRLLPSGRGQQRRSEPLGFRLPGGADRSFHLASFFRRESNSIHYRQTFCRKPGSAHFGFWVFFHFCLRKYLTRLLTIVYKSLASKFEAWSCRKNARTCSVRLANQAHPVAPGAGKKRLAMAVQDQQGAIVPAQARSLKIQPVGDAWRGTIKPQILLSGIWLQEAGFKAGHRVQVVIEQPGILTLRFQQQAKEAAL